MMRRLAVALSAWLALAGMFLSPATAQTGFTPRDESPEEFAAGAGRGGWVNPFAK
jgi:hypothetical protein